MAAVAYCEGWLGLYCLKAIRPHSRCSLIHVKATARIRNPNEKKPIRVSNCLTRVKVARCFFLFIASHRDLQIQDSIMTTVGINVPIGKVTPAAATKLRLGSLTALVIGSMVGSGVFSLPQNMAAGAGPLAILIGWAIT